MSYSFFDGYYIPYQKVIVPDRIIDPFYDAQMNLAKFIVKIIEKTNNFQDNTYHGLEEFYEKYMNHWNYQMELFYDIDEYEIDRGFITSDKRTKSVVYYQKADSECLTKVTEILNELRSYNALTLYHFMAAYVIYAREVFAKLRTDRTWLRKILLGYDYPSCDDEITLEYIDEKSKVYHDSRVVPFISNMGGFGLNTYLYLFFNGIFPIGISNVYHEVHPHPLVPEGQYQSMLQVIKHDFDHFLYISAMVSGYSKPYDKLHDINRVGEPLSEYHFERFKALYLHVITNQDLFTVNEVRLFIFAMFNLLHEACIGEKFYSECITDMLRENDIINDISVKGIFTSDDIYRGKLYNSLIGYDKYWLRGL